ncbi:MAG: hypothetical protein Q7P63_16660 [Verrucomicrobiota bacterium JB022]|nr:hypothetical protein [Verrucomicrobiota bacterium JB022]
MTRPLYIILGVNPADRILLADFLIRTGWEASEKVSLWLEEADLPTTEHKLARQIQIEAIASGTPTIPAGEESEAAFLLPPLGDDPRDWLEAVRGWQEEFDLDLARIITIFDCPAVHDHPSLRQWYDACMHFSDVLLFSHRDAVEKKWVSELERDLQKHAYPFMVATLKKSGAVEGPSELLFPEARRLSQFFDEPEPLEAPTEYMGIEIVDETPEEVLEEIEDEEGEAEPQPGDAASDPYLARYDYGQRKIKIPLPPQILA